MRFLQNLSGSATAGLLAVAIVGCSTAAVITGHISSSDYLAVLGSVGIGGGFVTTAHVVGTQVNAAGSPTPAPPAAPAAPPAAG